MDRFLSKSIKELSLIKPYWAIQDNICFLQDSDLISSEKLFEIYIIKTNELINQSDFKEVDLKSLFTIEALNNRRICRMLDHWSNQQFLDPPKIHFNSYTRKIEFEDGRHRAKLSYFLNFEKIPIAIHIDDIEKIKAFTGIILA